MEYLPRDIVTDVIVIVSEYEMTMGAKKINRDQMEEEIDKCDMCSLIFLNNYVFENINLVLHYVRNDLVVCIDGRVQLTEFWLEPMVARMSVHHNLNLVISPHLRLSSPDGEEINVGDYQTHITWDLGVVRSSDDQFLHEIHTNDPLFINQSAISKEVFLFSKEFIEYIYSFDVYPDISGSEDVAMSLKFIGCGADILQSRYSVVLIPLPDDEVLDESRIRFQPDIISPTFFIPERNISAHLSQTARVWLDWNIVDAYKCTRKGKTKSAPSLFMSFMRKETRERRILLDGLGCKLQKFNDQILPRQPRMSFPLENSTSYGFVRSLNGMYALGFSDVQSVFKLLHHDKRRKSFLSQKFIVSRNTSQWIGPFSYTNSNIVLNGSHCIAETVDGYFHLAKCSKIDKRQQFIFEDNRLKLKNNPKLCVGAKKSSDFSSYLRVINCDSMDGLFKFDIQFMDTCVKTLKRRALDI